MHDAARWNDVEALRRLLDEDPGLLEAEGDVGLRERPLHIACHAGSGEAAGYLLDRGATIDKKNACGETPLMLACSAGRVEVVRLLLARRADPTSHDRDLWTALMYALSGREHPGSGHEAVIRLLLEDGRVPVDARDSDGRTALMITCFHGHTERARVLLLEGLADPSIADNYGVTPMARAGRANHHETVRLLEVRA